MARSSPLSRLVRRSATTLFAAVFGVGMTFAGPAAPQARAADILGIPIDISGTLASGLTASTTPVDSAGPGFTTPNVLGVGDTFNTYHNTFTALDATLVPSSSLVPLANLADSLGAIAGTGLSPSTLVQLTTALTQIGQLASGLNNP